MPGSQALLDVLLGIKQSSQVRSNMCAWLCTRRAHRLRYRLKCGEKSRSPATTCTRRGVSSARQQAVVSCIMCGKAIVLVLRMHQPRRPAMPSLKPAATEVEQRRSAHTPCTRSKPCQLDEGEERKQAGVAPARLWPAAARLQAAVSPKVSPDNCKHSQAAGVLFFG